MRHHTDVLVVGAGPVGMFTALLLAREGIQVQVIDEAPGTAGQSYACGLHSRSLVLLREAGLHAALIRAGHRIDRVAFYEGEARRAEIEFATITPHMPFALVLPQSDLESGLEEVLQSEARLPISWNHRLAGLKQVDSGIVAEVEELGGTAVGYDVPRWETVVKRTFDISADVVIGCDGQNSVVRRDGGIKTQLLGAPELFVVYEFESPFEMPDEVRVVLNGDNANVLWPLGKNRYRWSFQWTDTAPDGGFPLKNRDHLWCEDQPVAAQTRQHLAGLLAARAPWFTGEVGAIEWATDVQFERRLARQFGRGRCWLAGDAAHQTGPIGVQSMNVGMREADVLARQVKRMLAEGGGAGPLDEYDEEFTAEWQKLLGLTSQLVPAREKKPLLKNRAALPSALLGSGAELDAMLDSLGLELKLFAPPTAQRR